MVLRDLIRDVFETLWAHKLRTALTMFGIAWGIISIVMMVAAGEGLRVGQAKVSQNFGRDLIIIFAGRTILQAGGTRAVRRIEFVDTDITVLQSDSPDCEWVIPELETSRAKIHSNYNASGQTVTGSYPAFRIAGRSAASHSRSKLTLLGAPLPAGAPVGLVLYGITMKQIGGISGLGWKFYSLKLAAQFIPWRFPEPSTCVAWPLARSAL